MKRAWWWSPQAQAASPGERHHMNPASSPPTPIPLRIPFPGRAQLILKVCKATLGWWGHISLHLGHTAAALGI